MTVRDPENSPLLIVTVGARACAIPLPYVTEIMRPLAIEPVGGTPSFVRGVSMIRGAPTPVIDLKALLENSENSSIYGRFVTMRIGERRIAIGVDGVIGLRSLDSAQLGELPPILRAVASDIIEVIGTLDAQLLVVLRVTRIVPEGVWTTLAAAEAM